MLDYVVVGTGRCGTGYIYRLLEEAGISATHEWYFGSHGPKGNRLMKPKHRVECSWMAVPYLNESYMSDTKVIHIVRQPMKVINSFLSISFFREIEKWTGSHKWYHKFAYDHLDGLKHENNPVSRAVYFFIKWNEMCYIKSDYLHRVEDDPIPLLEYVGGSTDNIFSDKEYNKYPRHQYGEIKLTIDDIVKYKDELIEMSEMLGYGEKT